MLYLLQVCVYTGIFSLLYILFLRNKPFHAFNRAYLLVAVVLSIALPFIVLPAAAVRNEINWSLRLPEFIINCKSQLAGMQLEIIPFIYFVISTILFTVTVCRYIMIMQVINKYKKERRTVYTLIMIPGMAPEAGIIISFFLPPVSMKQY